MSPLYYKSARELLSLIRSKEISPVELMEATLKRIDEVNPVLNAFVSVHAEQAMDEAKILMERIASGKEIGPLSAHRRTIRTERPQCR